MKGDSAACSARHDRPVRLLLVNPRLPESFWSFRWAVERVLPGTRALNPPLGLATLAALCPSHWEVRIVDENVEPVPADPDADLVGVCGMAVQAERQRALLRFYRGRGVRTVAGGSYASLCPERLRGVADTVVAGEAERIWPAFCRDLEDGRPQAEYVETGEVDLAESPVPRFDLLRLERYACVSLQFSRGCPYRCEFCDIVVMFGRRPRTKSPARIGAELDRLHALGARRAFFVDDNLIGHRPRAKALLRYLADWQRRHGHPFVFGTEASINLAGDPELLALFREAGFGWVFVGIESPDAASLRETGKVQNLREDPLESVRRIHRHGIDVLGGFIVGFDADDESTFERQIRFIHAAGIQVAMVGLLTALPRTPLHARLAREGRLLPEAACDDNTSAGTNVVPKRMTGEAMVAGYRRLWATLAADRSIAARIRAKARDLRDPVWTPTYTRAQSLGIVVRLLMHGVFPGGPARWARFLATFAASAPRAWPLVVNEWIAGIALSQYARSHLLGDAGAARRRGQRTANALRRRFAGALARGSFDVSLPPSGAELVLTLRGAIPPALFRVAARRIERLLRASRMRVVLHVEHVAGDQRQALARLLARLRPYGDRVSVRAARGLASSSCLDGLAFRVQHESE